MRRYILSGILALAASGLAQTPASNLQVDVGNFVLYNYDTFDTAQFGMNPNATSVKMKTYNYHISIADITAVGGAPARGTLLCTHTMFVLSPTAIVGSMAAMADTSRSMVDDCSVEILTSTGAAVGTIYFHGLFGGAPPPGAPMHSARSNLIVTGGTGAFLGVRGQATQTGPWTPRVASVTEDPASRRVNGGGEQSIILQLLPMFRPAIVLTSGVPAVVHSKDFSLVSTAKPAKAGEILTLFANGLGPTNPAVDYSQPFPPDSAPVTSPVQVDVSGAAGDVLYAGSYPGAVDGYLVNFRMPSGAASGSGTLVLTVGFIAGSPVTIPIE
jgi:uncharacterized protein (TIGR03437 family)